MSENKGLNKAELVKEIAKKGQIAKTVTEKVLNAMIETIEESLKEEQPVRLIGFGTFKVRKRAKRVGRDPKNPSKKIEIPARNTVVFVPSQELKNIVNK